VSARLVLVLATLVLLLGHIALWLRAVNHAHSFGLRRVISKGLTLLAMAGMLFMPLLFVLLHGREWLAVLKQGTWDGFWVPSETGLAWLLHWPLLGYAVLVAGHGLMTLAGWAARRFLHKPVGVLQSSTSQHLNLAQSLDFHPSGNGPRRFLTRLPGNQVFRLEVSEKVLEVARLDPALDGMTIAHLSDLHFIGTIDKTYFQEVVRLANAWSPDLVALTGDLVDDSKYISWIPDTLGQLRGKHGAYFVLGNHDKRVDEVELRRTLVQSGLVDLGSRTRRIAVGSRQLLLAGNERPWFGTAPTLSPCPEIESTERPLRIALAHSPDQFAWARKNDVDLLLAGHTHGGQIQVPGVGPLWAPSHRGVKYASGTFHKTPTTMHVSRGLSGLTPLRINCPPELTLLVLRSARGGD